MKTEFEIIPGQKSIENSNLFLRSLWAKIRKEFGGCSWQFSPRTQRKENLIYLGQFSTKYGDFDTVEVWIKYEQKGIAKRIIFNSRQKDISKLESRLKSLNPDPRANTERSYLSCIFESNYPVSGYRYEAFSIGQINPKQNEIKILVEGFDREDKLYVAKQKFNTIFDILASTIGVACRTVTRDELPASFEAPTQQNIYSDDLVFSIDEDFLVKDGNVYFPRKILGIIGDLIQEKEIPEKVQMLIAASKLYHSALKLETVMSVMMQNEIDFYELLVTKYMSSLEVLSYSPSDVSKCDNCGQNIYSISKRVKDLLILVFGENNLIVGQLHSLYGDRSKFLHTGKYLSNRAYLGTTIPQLTKTGDLVQHQFKYESGFVKYSVGQCFEHFVKELD